MKQIFLFLSIFLFAVSDLKSQTPFKNLGEVQQYIIDSITKRPDKITANTLNKAYNGVLEFIPVVGDTSAVVAPKYGYLRFQRSDSTAYVYDTIGTKRWRKYVPGSLVNGKLNISDTAAMLSNYAKQKSLNDTATALRGAIAAGGLSVDPTPTSGSPNPVQSGGVYTALQRKQNISDTAAMLVGYVRRKELGDTATALRNATSNLYVQWPLKMFNDSTFYMSQASATQDGYLDSLDWAHFNTAYDSFTQSGSYASGTITFTRRNGTTYTVTGLPAGGTGVTDGNKGDITVSGSGTTWKLNPFPFNGDVTKTDVIVLDTVANTYGRQKMTYIDTTGLSINDHIKYDGTKFVRDGAVYLTSYTETDPTVPALIKSIPVSADAAVNKYLNWNGSAYVRKQIAYSELSGTPAALTFNNSLVNTSNTVNLLGDVASPTASQYYGTNASSVRGWYNLPAGGGSLPALAQNHFYVGNASSVPVDAGSGFIYDTVLRRMLIGNTGGGFINNNPLQINGSMSIFGNIDGVGRISNNNYSSYSYLILPYDPNGWRFFTTNTLKNQGLERLHIGAAADIADFSILQSNLIVQTLKTTGTAPTTTGTVQMVTTDANGKFSFQAIPSSGGITSLNGLTAATQTFATGTTGTDFNISSTTSTHTFNIPDASTSARGLVTTGAQTFAGNKTFSGTVTHKTTVFDELNYTAPASGNDAVVTIAIPTSYAYTIKYTTVGINLTNSTAASATRIVTVRNIAGTLTIVGTETTVSSQADAAFTVNIPAATISGTNIILRGYGATGGAIAYTISYEIIKTPAGS